MKHPAWFALAGSVAWLVVLLVLTGLASAALGRPYGDSLSSAIARLSTTAVVVSLLWRLGWIASSGIARAGDWRIWLLATAGLVYGLGASLYAFYGRAAFDASVLVRMPAARTTAGLVFVGALAEEVFFRGLLLHAFVRAAGSNRARAAAGVVIVSVIFAGLHTLQVLTDDLSRTAALLLVAQTLIVSVWWGAVVVAGGSIWPAVALHFAVNAAAALQGLATPVAVPGVGAYERHLWLSLPLGLAGAALLAGFGRRPAQVRTDQVRQG